MCPTEKAVKYPGWNLEKTLLVRSGSGARTPELIDVRLPVQAVAARNIANDVRVVSKKDWNLVESEIPSQVYAIRQHGETASFRVAFNMDVPAAGEPPRRVGVYYDNPAASAPHYPSPIEVEGTGLHAVIRTPAYAVETDGGCGIIRSIAGRLDLLRAGQEPANRDACPTAQFVDVAQENPAVVFAVEGKGSVRPVEAIPAGWTDVELVEDLRGPVFIKRTCRGRLTYPGCPSSCRPTAEVTYKFFAEQPYFLAHTRLVFPEDAAVFGIRVGGLTVARGSCTHYTFRPVSPDLPDTDIEEMGHILVDPALTADLPPGNVFSSLLPYEIAWDAFLNTGEGSRRAIACIQLSHTLRAPGPFPCYRSGSYLVRAEKTLCSSRSPVHVVSRGRRENIVTIPAGSVVEELDAVVCDAFDRDWGHRTDAAGRRLNTPVDVSVYPRFMGGEVPPEPFEPLPRGERRDAYLRSGVR